MIRRWWFQIIHKYNWFWPERLTSVLSQGKNSTSSCFFIFPLSIWFLIIMCLYMSTQLSKNLTLFVWYWRIIYWNLITNKTIFCFNRASIILPFISEVFYSLWSEVEFVPFLNEIISANIFTLKEIFNLKYDFILHDNIII